MWGHDVEECTNLLNFSKNWNMNSRRKKEKYEVWAGKYISWKDAVHTPEEDWKNVEQILEKQIPENEAKILSAGHWQERFHLSKFQFVILPSKSNTEGLKPKILPHFLIQHQQTFDFHISLWGEIRRKREHRTAQLFILKAQSFLSWIVFCANAFGKVTVWDNLHIHCMQLRQTSEQKYLFRGMLYVIQQWRSRSIFHWKI